MDKGECYALGLWFVSGVGLANPSFAILLLALCLFELWRREENKESKN